MSAAIIDLSDLGRLKRRAVGRGYHPARVHERDVVYHVISKTYQGRMLLTPCAELNMIVAGVIGRAQLLFSTVELFSYAFMTNHFHLMLRGAEDEIPAFVGFIKRELSRRWGGMAGWTNGLWSDSYRSTALPTLDSQRQCYRYILSQGVKEGLVDVPERWPGVHIAHQLFDNAVLTGKWLCGTTYAKARHKDNLRAAPHGVERDDHTETYCVRVDRLPAFASYTEQELGNVVAKMRQEIVDDRPRTKPLTPKEVRQLTRRDFERSASLPRLPWWEHRRRMIVWAAHDANETRNYLSRYWMKQWAFRRASLVRRIAKDVCGYPRGMFSAGRFESPAG